MNKLQKIALEMLKESQSQIAYDAYDAYDIVNPWANPWAVKTQTNDWTADQWNSLLSFLQARANAQYKNFDDKSKIGLPSERNDAIQQRNNKRTYLVKIQALINNLQKIIAKKKLSGGQLVPIPNNLIGGTSQSSDLGGGGGNRRAPGSRPRGGQSDNDSENSEDRDAIDEKLKIAPMDGKYIRIKDLIKAYNIIKYMNLTESAFPTSLNYQPWASGWSNAIDKDLSAYIRFDERMKAYYVHFVMEALTLIREAYEKYITEDKDYKQPNDKQMKLFNDLIAGIKRATVDFPITEPTLAATK